VLTGVTSSYLHFYFIDKPLHNTHDYVTIQEMHGVVKKKSFLSTISKQYGVENFIEILMMKVKKMDTNRIERNIWGRE
jgi:hypothetical protein